MIRGDILEYIHTHFFFKEEDMERKRIIFS